MADANRQSVVASGRVHSAEVDVLAKAADWSRWLAFGVVLIAGGRLLGLPTLSASAALVVAGLGFLAGIPHGGVDHLMAMRLAGRRIAPVVLAYAGLAAAAWSLLKWGGPAALIVVVALSALHFGLGELVVTRELSGWRPPRITAAAIVVAGSGALLLPLARSGEQFSDVATAVAPGLAHVIGAAPVRTAVLLIWLAAAIVGTVTSLVAGRTGAALDIVLIGALGMLVQPLVAFAAWFGGWHALRHSARMLTEEPGCSALVAQGRSRAAFRRLAGLAAPMSVAALAVIVALAWFAVTAPEPATVLAEVLRLLLALTVPHMAVVWWLDRHAEA